MFPNVRKPKCEDVTCPKEYICSVTTCGRGLCRHNVIHVTVGRSTFTRCRLHECIGEAVAKQILQKAPSCRNATILGKGEEKTWGERTFYAFTVQYVSNRLQKFAVFSDTGEIMTPPPTYHK